MVRPRHSEGTCAQLHPALLASQGEGEQERYYARVGSARMFSPTANAPNRWAVRCSFAFMWPELTCDPGNIFSCRCASADYPPCASLAC